MGLVGRKVISITMIMTLVIEEALANFVPAAAVIREGLALSGMIWRKGFVGCRLLLLVKFLTLLVKYACKTSMLEYKRG
jgi:hypothetical protein